MSNLSRLTRRWLQRGLWLALLALAALASPACRGPELVQGAGGQSGDEGRKAPPAPLERGRSSLR